MRKFFTVVLALCLVQILNAATFRTYQGFELVNPTTVRIWINSDTAPGETAIAQIKYGSPSTFSGFQNGSFENNATFGANWKVEFTVPSGTTSIEIELATKNEFGNDYGFTGFIYAESNLPVELTSFVAKPQPKAVALTWTTSSEENNAGFEVQKSVNGKDFETIGFVEGNGTSVEVNTYSFVDENPVAGASYYRLKQNDFDGNFEYSTILTVQFDEKATATIYPNPTSEKLVIATEVQEEVNIRIFNMNGQVVYQNTKRVDNQLEINLDELVNGNYILQVRNAANQAVIYSGNFVKQ